MSANDLREWMQCNGMMRKPLAKKIGVLPGCIDKWLASVRTMPKWVPIMLTYLSKSFFHNRLPYVLCKCGCGQYTMIHPVIGQRNLYLNGHWGEMRSAIKADVKPVILQVCPKCKGSMASGNVTTATGEFVPGQQCRDCRTIHLIA